MNWRHFGLRDTRGRALLALCLLSLACGDEGGGDTVGASTGAEGSTTSVASSSGSTASGSSGAVGSSSGVADSSSSGTASTGSGGSGTTGTTGTTGGLHPAFAEFDAENFTITLDGDEVVLESNGLANHVSPYWSNTTARASPDGMGPATPAADEDHPLFVAPTATSFESMAPGNIDDFMGSFELRVPVSPQRADQSTATGLGPIGMAVSGAMIYNDEEGPNVPLDNAVPSLDFTAAHTGPQSYHYHLEPKAWSDDDDVLIGVMADGFFLYGRRDSATGDYPDDLDVSGGHEGMTPHARTPEYHYHIQNEAYLNEYYVLFPGDYQGTPTGIQ